MGSAYRPAMNVQMGQSMVMTPQLLQSIRLLQLSGLELEQEVRAALANNPLLEADENGEEEDSQDETARAEAVEDERCDVPVTGCDVAAPARIEADYTSSASESWSSGEAREDDDEALDNRRAAPTQTDARLSAIEQMPFILKDPRDAPRVELLLENIDGNGYVEKPLVELAREAGVDEAQLERVLMLVQRVEPTGFGARDLRECLLLQLRVLPRRTPGRELAEYLVSACLERLGGGDLAEVREALGVSPQQMRKAVDLILAQNPKPGASLAAEATAIIPDLRVRGKDGEWTVEMNDSALPRIRINTLYEKALANNPHRALKEQLLEARWLVRGLEMRHETLLKTARAIFERQQGFLARGEVGMKPLTLREIAEAIGMHESTVCRVTSNKYIETPWGVYELKDFFPSQITGAEGDTSGTAVRALIRRMIDTEKHTAPLCDGDLTALLARQGVRVARRTVAKYREAMHIAPAKERHHRSASRACALAG